MNKRDKICYSYIQKENGNYAIVYKYQGENIIIVDNIKPGNLDNTTKKLEKDFANQSRIKTFEKYLEKKAKTNLNIKRLDGEVKNLSQKNKKFLQENGYEIIRRPQSTVNIELIDRNGFIRALGEEKITDFIKLSQHKSKNKIIDQGKIILKNDPSKVGQLYKKPTKTGIPISDFGTSPTFKGLKKYINGGKLGNGKIPKGAERDVRNMLNLINKNNGEVKTFLTGDRPADFKNCWRSMGVNDEKVINRYQELCEKMKLTWHHLDDLDHNLQSSFQLISTPLHNSTLPHMGSFAQLEEVYRQLKNY